MTFYSAYQWNAYQWNAYQIARAAPSPSGFGEDKRFAYLTPQQRLRIEEEKRAKLKRDKTDLERLDSVLRENYRKKALAGQNKLIAKAERAIELAALEQEYLLEINRLLAVRAELMRQMKRTEAIIMVLVIMRKRRLRFAF